MIEKAICVWYVSVSSSCLRAFFARSIFEVRNSKFVVFSVLTREFVLFQEIVLYMAISGRLRQVQQTIGAVFGFRTSTHRHATKFTESPRFGKRRLLEQSVVR